MTDNEVPTYILAYLLQHNYQQTAAAFMQECSLLPSEAVMVFPETTLQNIIAEYKSHKDTRVMLGTLGNVGAWQVLWKTLDNTVTQMKAMADELFCDKPVTTRGPASNKRSIRLGLTTTQPSTSHPPRTNTAAVVPSMTNPATASSSDTVPQTSMAVINTASSNPPTPAAQLASSSHQRNVQQSPHKRKAAPKRKFPESPCKSGPQSSTATNEAQPQMGSTPPTMQLLETFLGDDHLPEKLAEIINKCVSKEDIASEGQRDAEQQQQQQEMAETDHQLSPSTLENIFNLTFSDPIFEGILGLDSDNPGTTLPPPPSSSAVAPTSTCTDTKFPTLLPSSANVTDPQSSFPTLPTGVKITDPQSSTDPQKFTKIALNFGSHSVKKPLSLSSMASLQSAGDGSRQSVANSGAVPTSLWHRPVQVKVISKHVDGLPSKRPRLSGDGSGGSTATSEGLPSEMDIEKFLDQIHKQ